MHFNAAFTRWTARIGSDDTDGYFRSVDGHAMARIRVAQQFDRKTNTLIVVDSDVTVTIPINVNVFKVQIIFRCPSRTESPAGAFGESIRITLRSQCTSIVSNGISSIGNNPQYNTKERNCGAEKIAQLAYKLSLCVNLLKLHLCALYLMQP